MSNVTNTILPPWAIVTLPQYMRDELRRRSGHVNTNGGHYNFNYTVNTTEWDGSYKGPMTTWIRVASNANDGFVFFNKGNYEDIYGFEKTGGAKKQIIGHTLNGRKHELPIDTIQPHRPIPGIESIDVEVKNSIYRKARIKWKCYSIDQLNYVGEYMFSPYITIMVEWGWNLFDIRSLLDYKDIGSPPEYLTIDGKKTEQIDPKKRGSGLVGAYMNPQLIEDAIARSRGNYDAMIGHVVNFEYTFNTSDNSFDCTSEISGNSKYYFGLAVQNLTVASQENNDKEKQNSKQLSFKSYFTDDFEKNIGKAIENPNHPINLVKRGEQSIKSNGRIFNTRAYAADKGIQNSIKNRTYITMGLFIELLNTFILTKIDISGIRIGAHPNMISPSVDFIIPNKMCPFINSLCLSNPKNKKIDFNIDTSQSELPYGKPPKISDSKESYDLILKNILSKYGEVYRQDIDSVVNYNRRSPNSITCFPAGARKQSDPVEKLDDKQKNYFGYLEDIYISTDLIKRAAGQTNFGDVIAVICNHLNTEMPVWQLELIATNSNLLTIVDTRYVDLEVMRTKTDLRVGEPIIYFFDTFSQNSIVSGYEFSVKLSDAAATMIINKVNSNEIQPTSSEIISNSNPLDIIKRPKDLLYSQVPQDKPTMVTEENKLTKEEFDKKIKENKNINDKSLAYILNQNNGRVEMLRLCLPDTFKDTLQVMLNDSSLAFTNIASMPIPGTSVSFTLPGIAGFKTFQVFGISNLPKPYDKDIIFKILDVNHSIKSGEGWTTHISAKILPMKNAQVTYGQS